MRCSSLLRKQTKGKEKEEEEEEKKSELQKVSPATASHIFPSTFPHRK